MTLRLDSSLDEASAARNFTLALSGGAIPLNGVAAVVTLPDALKFVADSARVDGQPVAVADDDGALTFRLGNTAAAFERIVTFAADVAVADARRRPRKALAMFEVDGKRLRTPVVSTIVGAVRRRRPNQPTSPSSK